MTPIALPVNGVITEALPRPHRDDTLVVDNRSMTTNQHTERGTVMTVQTAHPGHHISTKSAAVALAGAALAVAAGFGIATVVIDEATPVPTDTSRVVPDGDGIPNESGVFPGTDLEERGLMHRR